MTNQTDAQIARYIVKGEGLAPFTKVLTGKGSMRGYTEVRGTFNTKEDCRQLFKALQGRGFYNGLSGTELDRDAFGGPENYPRQFNLSLKRRA